MFATGYRELAADDILLDRILVGVEVRRCVEDYPDRVRSRRVVLQRDRNGLPST